MGDSARNEELLSVRSLSVNFGGLRAVDDVSFDVGEAAIVAMIGPNGAGKTTLFNLISGFIKSDTGTVRFDGKPLSRRPAFMRARTGMVRTFQIPKVFARLSVLDNVMMASKEQAAQRLHRAVVPLAGRSAERRDRDRALELLDTFGLKAKSDDYAGELSGGQRKLLELARALMPRPKLLLLDEPMAGVNPTLGNELIGHVRSLRESEGITFLFIEHDMDVVMNNSDRVICLSQGAVIADGTPDEVRTDRRVIDAYLGADEVEHGA